MFQGSDKYAHFVEHPRYGRGPQFTGLNPNPKDAGVWLAIGSLTPDEIEFITGKTYAYSLSSLGSTPRIPNTAIASDLAKLVGATIPVSHYFDLERTCRDCARQFIFFAQEQKHWYEELGFKLDSDCVYCIECRKRRQGVQRLRERYESLFHVTNRTDEQNLEMADACLTLVELGVFHTRARERVRMLLNSIPPHSELRRLTKYTDLAKRAHGGENH